MDARRLLRRMCHRHGLPFQDASRLLPLVERALISPIDVRDRILHLVDDNLARISFSMRAHRRQGRPLRGLAAGALKQLARLGPLRWLAGYRYVLAPSQLLMTGVKSLD